MLCADVIENSSAIETEPMSVGEARRPRCLERLVAGWRRRSRLAPRQRGGGLFHQAQFATLLLNSEAAEMYFTSDPLAFMKERFISGIGTIRRAGKSEGRPNPRANKAGGCAMRWMSDDFNESPAAWQEYRKLSRSAGTVGGRRLNRAISFSWASQTSPQLLA